ncbi:hypothetical protein, conserved [Babesia ovata]|uniref:Uncharacterized protein n=1 Tax=Babesia ovata TaxID=189622 RepID=A0A2H6KBX2_9APIC|nr:uncharacterized protein BOVATA_019840 [Babesia ovata]GBE60491.1 hypothetical protein, conserved [Babesia ovata]
MVYNSLTEAPHNLKEAIDWLIALKGTDAESNLKAMGEAIYNLLGSDTIGGKMLPALKIIRRISQNFLQKKELHDQAFVKSALRQLNQLMDKTPGGIAIPKSVTPDTIANNLAHVVVGAEIFLNDIKDLDQYVSSYSSEATWANSCSMKPEACAVVFVGIAPMLFTGLRYLNSACLGSTRSGSKSISKERLEEVLKSLGYRDPHCKDGISGADVISALRAVDKKTMATLHDLASI